MRYTAMSLFCSLVLLTGAASTASPEEPALVYQRIHALVAHHDNRITLRVWDDGQVEVRFPAYTPRAGLYRGRLDHSGMESLDRLVSELVEIQPGDLTARINQVRSNNLAEVSDADIVRFIHRQPGREPVELRTPAPDVWSTRAPEIAELRKIEQLEKDLRAWMDQKMHLLERQP
jgi:hypothetical protein